MLDDNVYAFIRENLPALAKEIKDWKHTGLLHGGTGGFLRELATLIQDDVNNEFGMCLRLAEHMVYDYCIDWIIENE
jgi:hypothetical protein